jgi:hypothetical protein
LEDETTENLKVESENKMLRITIARLKNEIRDKDQDAVQMHMKQKGIYEELGNLVQKVEALAQKVKAGDEKCAEYKNKLQRALHLFDQAEIDMLKQRQVLQKFGSSAITVNARVCKYNHHAEVLREKVSIIIGVINSADANYKKQCNLVETLTNDLTREVARRNDLMEKRVHRHVLMCEEVRMQKELLLQKGKTRALEEEMERPLNLHRWRLMEATNPEWEQMIRMSHELRGRLMSKIGQLSGLRGKKEMMEKRADRFIGHLRYGYAGNIGDEMEYLNELLRQKQRQLAFIEAQMQGGKESVIEHRDQVSTIRMQVREEKSGYFDTKKRVDGYRASTALEKSRGAKGSQNTAPETRYIGGGFAVSGIGRNVVEMPPLSPNVPHSSTMVSPSIIHPKSASVLNRKVMRGRYPLRTAVKSRLEPSVFK